MKKEIKKIIKKIKNSIIEYDKFNRHSSTKLLEWEIEEMQNIFSLILFGFMVGYPSAPMHITLDLLPFLGDDLEILLEKVNVSHDPLAELFSLLDIG